MKQIFTSNDLLRYIYKEMDTQEEKSIEQQLSHDPALSHEYHILLDGIAIIGNADIAPGSEVLHDLKMKLDRRTASHTA